MTAAGGRWGPAAAPRSPSPRPGSARRRRARAGGAAAALCSGPGPGRRRGAALRERAAAMRRRARRGPSRAVPGRAFVGRAAPAGERQTKGSGRPQRAAPRRHRHRHRHRPAPRRGSGRAPRRHPPALGSPLAYRGGDAAAGRCPGRAPPGAALEQRGGCGAPAAGWFPGRRSQTPASFVTETCRGGIQHRSRWRAPRRSCRRGSSSGARKKCDIADGVRKLFCCAVLGVKYGFGGEDLGVSVVSKTSSLISFFLSFFFCLFVLVTSVIALSFIVFSPVYVTYFESSLPSSVINSIQRLV